MNDKVHHPKHYNNHPSGIECITVTRHMNFNRGNAVKYIWRAGDKGNEIEDLEKAIWYLNDEVSRLRDLEAARPAPDNNVEEGEVGIRGAESVPRRNPFDKPPTCERSIWDIIDKNF